MPNLYLKIDDAPVHRTTVNSRTKRRIRRTVTQFPIGRNFSVYIVTQIRTTHEKKSQNQKCPHVK